MERKTTVLFIFIVLSLCTSNARAQTEKNKAGEHKGLKQVLFFPEFYHYEIVRSGDTTLKYECYDDKDGRINVDTLHNSELVDEIIFVKSFFDRRFSSGPGISPPYITNKEIAYNKVAVNSWAATDVTTNSSTELKGDLDKIVRTDSTVVIDPTTGVKLLIVRKYYEVAEVPEGERHKNVHTR